MAPVCFNFETCLLVNGTETSVLEAFSLIARGWYSPVAARLMLEYEFGIVVRTQQPKQANSAVIYRPRRPFSPATSATFGNLPLGRQTLYVCARVASTVGTAAGPHACETVDVTVNAKVSAVQVTQQLAELTAAVTSSSSGGAAAAATLAELAQLAHRLAAVASVVQDSSSVGVAVASLASGLLTQLFNRTIGRASRLGVGGSPVTNTASAPVHGPPITMNPPTAASIVSVFDAVGSLWGMSSDTGRAAVVGSISALSDQLAGESLEAADALPVIDLLTSMLEDQASLVATAAAANGGASQAAAKADAAKAVLASITHGTAALTRSLLNGAPADGTPAHIATAKLAAAVQRASAALAAAGITVSVANPGSASSSGRRLLSSSSSAVGVALSPAVSQLCTADATCATAGFGVAVTVVPDSSLLLTSLGDNAAALAALLSDYRAGGSVQVISPIVRVAAPGLPASAYGGALASLVVLDLPINLKAVALDGATTRRALVRLQDVSAAAPDASAAISAAVSVTVTSNSGPATGAVDLISGFSNSFGDFVVLQYTSTATPTAGNTNTSPSPSGAPSSTASVSPSPLPSSLPPGGAGSMVAPSAAITSILLGLVVLLLLL
ncbi:hypothetical protein CHLRE_05g235600v5 [Chlamydomonas reinhardtii]|uniref:Uncharacterized protein n=1 Tax=Chlamydomonas reinhardtii TaxID=3055 RepID=A0A2K3DSV5_CHLRE|nr:uncharacterized protein CHLRE_05g235600v5 [Chlamydomonas reinhardtii]PNW83578.1 hypothetical protein CHLRE_05g235600v5 [Chlamydomonas reinhardtii]